MTATIKQIAEALGMNPSTVSRALSGHPQIADATREKVLCMAEKLHYTPNLWAQNLVGAATNLIGCLVQELSNPFYIPMVRAVEDVAKENDYIIFIGESRNDLGVEKHVIDKFRRVRASGLIITPVLSNLDHLSQLEREGVAVVIAGRDLEKFDAINVDNVKSGRTAGRHLSDSGYKHIAYIQSGNEYNIPEKERLKGLKEVLDENGLPLETIYTVGNNRINNGEKAGEMWMHAGKRPDAVFCSNDLLAMGFVQYILKKGLRIPDDVAVLGHDDIPFADNFIVPLSTIAFPKYEMGQLAMQILLQRITKPDALHIPKHFALEPDLVIRKSC